MIVWRCHFGWRPTVVSIAVRESCPDSQTVRHRCSCVVVFAWDALKYSCFMQMYSCFCIYVRRYVSAACVRGCASYRRVWSGTTQKQKSSPRKTKFNKFIVRSAWYETLFCSCVLVKRRYFLLLFSFIYLFFWSLSQKHLNGVIYSMCR